MGEMPGPIHNPENNRRPEGNLGRVLGSVVRPLSVDDLAYKLGIEPSDIRSMAQQEGLQPLTRETVRGVLTTQKKAEILRRLLRGRDPSSASIEDLLAILDHSERARGFLSELPLSGSDTKAKIPRISLTSSIPPAVPGEEPPLATVKQIESLLAELQRFEQNSEAERMMARYIAGDGSDDSTYFGTDRLEDYFPELGSKE